MEWFEGETYDAFVVNEHLGNLFGVEDEFYIEDYRASHWSLAKDNQVVINHNNGNSFWPIKDVKDIDEYTAILFRGCPNRIFILNAGKKLPLDEYRNTYDC